MHSTDPIDLYALAALLDNRDRGLLHAVRDVGDKQTPRSSTSFGLARCSR
jgi:hypothetical protein